MNNKDIDLTNALREKMKSRPRVRGRYNSSELWGILNGYTTPEEWLHPKERTPIELLRMQMGIIVHDHIQKLLPPEGNEVKKEYHYQDIVLVAKVDHLPPHLPDEVWELKTSQEPMEHAKPWACEQIKLYLSIFERPKGIIFQPVSNAQGLFLKRIGEVCRDDKWFLGQMEALVKFHRKVELLYGSIN